MNKNSKFIQNLSIGAIIISILISGYILLKPSANQPVSQKSGGNGDISLVDGKQVIKMTVFADRYEPEYFTIKAGVPVRWEITSSGQPGCDSGAIIPKGFGNGTIYLNPDQGQVTVSEFTVQNPGTYKFGCPMFMVRGTVQVNN